MTDPTPCRCGVRGCMTPGTIREKVAACREYHFICPKADRLLRAAERRSSTRARIDKLTNGAR